jgi:KipI family sensor histidine kinase inhibitor
MGRRAVLIDDLDDPAGWSVAFRSRRIPGVVDVVPAARTVLISCNSSATLATLDLDDVVDVVLQGGSGVTVEIPVVYDGVDLDHVARQTNLSVAEVIEVHSRTTFEVAFCGFTPGFAYLRELPGILQLPRRETPRTRVPAGSVAIATEYSAVYPRSSPGGWHLLGTTDVILFDASLSDPALLKPGDSVRFVPR